VIIGQFANVVLGTCPSPGAVNDRRRSVDSSWRYATMRSHVHVALVRAASDNVLLSASRRAAGISRLHPIP